MPDVPVYFYDSNGNIVKEDRKIRRLIKEGKGQFKFNFSIRGHRYKRACINPKTGKPATTSKEAEEIARQMYDAVINDTYAETTKNPTLADFAKNIYLKTILRNRRSKEFYTTIVGVICRSPLGEMGIRKITSDDIEDHLTRRAGEITKRKTQRSGASLNRER